ncbi:MAG: WD40 repeat domain-containing protein [Minicystis sp.]
MSAAHLNAFCIDASEHFVFGGDKSGRIWVIDPDTLDVLHTVQAHAGTIQGMAAHPTKPLFAVLGKDRAVSVWVHDPGGDLECLFWHSIRDYTPDDLGPIHSECQGIALHPYEPRLVTRSGNGAVIELWFEDPANIRLLRCVRACAAADLMSVAYSADGKTILAGSAQGHIAVLAGGDEPALHQFPGFTESIHWFEPMPDGSYLVANDARKLLAFHPARPEAARWGNILSCDDFEHVTYNPASGRVIASSFDRNVYEIDPATLDVKMVVFRAPFKVRWIKSLRRAPNALIAQVRDGALVRVDLATGQPAARLQQASPALWTMAGTPAGTVLVAGEGQAYWEVTAGDTGPDRAYDLSWKRRDLPAGEGGYTKRVAVQPGTRHRFFGRTDGAIWVARCGGRPELLLDVGAAIQDLTVMVGDPWLFAVTEAGEVLRIHAERGHVAARVRFAAPLWSMALNEYQGFLAVGERMGSLRILRTHNLTEITAVPARLPRRARWLDGNTLLAGHGGDIDRFSYHDGCWIHEVSVFAGPGSAVEDFDWTEDRRYLVAVTRDRQVAVFDLSTGARLDVACDGLDDPKSILRLPEGANTSGYPYDFLVVGRTGTGRVYRIHDEKLAVIHVSRGLLRQGD